jgi:hypothetical protein
MPRGKSTVEYVLISDPTKLVKEQEGYLLLVEGRSYADKNHHKALELALLKYEEGEFPDDKFPDGITLEHILPAAPEPLALEEQELLPIQIGAREVVELVRLQVDVQDAIEEVIPYRGTLEKLKDYGSEAQALLTPEEKEKVRDRNFPKVLNQMASAIVSQEDYRQNCTGYYKMIIDIIENYKKETVSYNNYEAPETIIIEESKEVGSKNFQNGN